MHRKPQNPRKCSVCKSKPGIYKSSGFSVWCGDVECGTTLSLQLRAKETERKAKAERKHFRERKAKINDTVPKWTKKAQAAFNEYIRERDRDLPCISCGKPFLDVKGITGSNIDCGHYRSTGSCPELRFEPLNANAQHSRPCNRDLSGDIVNYRRGLIDKIGIEKVEWIEGPHEKKYYRVEDLKEITKHFKSLTKQLRAERK